MRQGHNNKRMRQRGRKGPNPMARSYESNGPDVKIRGTALHIAEKYTQLARDAASSGDRVAEQNYLQHAEHYYRIVAAAQAQMPQPQPIHRPDEDDDEDGGERPFQQMDRPMQPRHEGPVSYGGSEPQPYVNGGPFNGHPDQPQAEASDDAPEGEFDDDDESGDETSAEAGAGGEQPVYRMRRRRGRGRRRPEGSGGEGGGAPVQQPAPATVDD
ncbi:MAG: DUF4167 domain-containing protein [Bauldia sp.]|nr:DUF4167 domain-containing protein [Bauldia sp.]